MAIPRSKYSQPRHTPGREFTLEGRNYVGWYVVTFQDRYFAGESLDKNSKEILPIQETTVQTNTQKVFVEQKVEPSIDDRVRGEWTRYFLQNKANLHIIEVKKDRFDAYKKTPNIVLGKLKWNLKGPADNVIKGPYVYYGASHQNRLATEKLETTLKGITNFIKDYSEFVE